MSWALFVIVLVGSVFLFPEVYINLSRSLRRKMRKQMQKLMAKEEWEQHERKLPNL